MAAPASKCQYGIGRDLAIDELVRLGAILGVVLHHLPAIRTGASSRSTSQLTGQASFFEDVGDPPPSAARSRRQSLSWLKPALGASNGLDDRSMVSREIELPAVRTNAPCDGVLRISFSPSRREYDT
jgi:hypothetical protein